MSNRCSNCGRLIGPEEVSYIEYNDYGIPVPICDECDTGNLDHTELDEEDDWAMLWKIRQRELSLP